jgi:hypothetical protein
VATTLRKSPVVRLFKEVTGCFWSITTAIVLKNPMAIKMVVPAKLENTFLTNDHVIWWKVWRKLTMTLVSPKS